MIGPQRVNRFSGLPLAPVCNRATVSRNRPGGPLPPDRLCTCCGNCSDYSQALETRMPELAQ